MAAGCVYDLHQTSDFDEIVVADADEENARRLLEVIDDDRFRFESVTQPTRTISREFSRVPTTSSTACPTRSRRTFSMRCKRWATSQASI